MLAAQKLCQDAIKCNDKTLHLHYIYYVNRVSCAAFTDRIS